MATVLRVVDVSFRVASKGKPVADMLDTIDGTLAAERNVGPG